MKSNIHSLKYLFTTCCSIFISQLIFSGMATAQATDFFRNPMDIPIKLSANFGEIRTNHFHTGFDIRTNAETGYKVYAAADGVISRIKVSAGGFGNVLYISHPNGYMTVYAHLDRFNDAIAAYVKQQQYAKQSFEIELFPDAAKFPVKKSDLIAYSGNSGSSGGPHLHFEIRDASGETFPLNPASFYKLADTIAPKFSAVHLYNINKTTGAPVQYPIKKLKSGYTLANDSIVTEDKFIGVGVEAADYMNQSSNDYGVFEYSVKLDGNHIYKVQFNRLDFANGRFLNSFIDYYIMKTSGKNIQRLFRLPGDRNTIYHDLVNDGKISISDSAYHKVEVIAKDAYGNASALFFYVKSNHQGVTKKSEPQAGRIFRYDQPNSFSADSIQLILPANILYEDLPFSYAATVGSDAKRFSSTHRVQNANVPVHDSYTISILPRFIQPALQSKAVIAYDDGKGNRTTKTSHWDGKWLSAKAREFGYFYILIDTVKPKITPVNVKQNQLVTAGVLKFTISDDLSGIVSYNGFLDGKWILMEYDAKNKLLKCDLDPNIAQGEHILKLIVTDDVKNEGSYILKFKK